MSPVFEHGALRLYLLKLLEEQPRHGYDLMQQLETRFGGLYSPSAGTIYPRLSRLQEAGLIEPVAGEDGRKTYRVTDAGRAELAARVGDLVALEQQMTRSARVLAQEIRGDVRASVRDLKADLRSAARDARRAPRRPERPTAAAEAERFAQQLTARLGVLRDGEAERLRAELDRALPAVVAAVRRPSP